MNTWTIEYDNDTAPDDEEFWQWWTVTNGKRRFDCKREKDAEWLCIALNRLESEQ